MNVFLAATDVGLVIPLVDESGNILDITAIDYKITDSLGAEVVPLGSLADFAPSSASASVNVPAERNTLTGVTRELRQIELHCVLANLNTIVITASYIIENGDVLEIGTNSFQSLAQAEFNAALIPSLNGWNGANTRQQIAALIDARLHICQLNFSPLNSNKLWGQDSLNFVPEGSFSTQYVVRQGGFAWGGNLTFVKPEQFLKLPDLFRKALNQAQIAEADSILGGDPIAQKRRSGLMLDTVGESKQMYRSSRPLELPVSRRALSYLSQFISFSKHINRQ